LQTQLENLDEIDKSVEYINKIVGDLQDYARPIKPIIRETDLEGVISNVFVKTHIPQEIKASCKVEKDAKRILMAPDLLNRMIGNLVMNAVQAMPDGGDLVVKAFREADEIVLTVEDDGVGIP
jgi:signal transduction histidine kinase